MVSASVDSLTAFGRRFWRRENASIRLTSSAPCLAAWRVMSKICLLVVELRPPLEQAQAAQDRCQQIVEIMGEAAGQLADRIEPLRLHQPVFEHVAAR